MGGGGKSTDNQPVSGNRVQEFIKNQLRSKAGVFYYDTINNRYLVFSDAESRDAYLEDNTKIELVLATFEAPYNYSAEIQMISPTYVAILDGEKGNIINFTFDTKNKNGQSIGEDVIVSFNITRNSVKHSISQKYHPGQTVSFNIDDYIAEGTNTIQITVSGLNTFAATTVAVVYQVVNLSLTDEFDISKPISPEDSVLEVPYTVSGYGIKNMEWYIDGIKLDYISTEDEITSASASKVKYINVGTLTNGTHNLQFRTYTTINEEKFYSKLIYRDFMYNKGTDMSPMVAVGTEFSPKTDIITDNLIINNVIQFVAYDLKIAMFNPTYATSTPLYVYINDELKTTLLMKNNTVEIYPISVDTYGTCYLKLVTGGRTYNIRMDVSKSPAVLEEITDSLTLALKATGKSNTSVDRDVWTYNSYITTFNDFAWNSNSGWNNNRLFITDGSSIDINMSPLATDALSFGKTFEFEFTAKNIYYDDSIICDLRNDNGTGILITASEVSLKSANGVSISEKYKPDENIRISFVINRKTGSIHKLLAFIYVNGIRSRAINFVETDNFLVDKNITISSEGADIELKELRFYDSALTPEQILNNYIMSRDSVTEMQRVYERNNIYIDGTTELSPDILSAQLPVMLITGDIPALENTTDKNLQITVDVEYTNIKEPSRSFKMKNAAMRPQGTSSMAYPKKNFRIYTTKKDTTILYDSEGNVVEDRKYSFKAGAQPVTCWCFKADFAESSGTHNTGIARLWNDVMYNAQINNEYVFRTEAQKSALENEYPYDVRTTIDGFPILMFYRLTENDPIVYIGKYNFNNDKSTESVFGFKDIPGFDNTNMQCWEVLNNGNHLALFQDTDNWNSEWTEAFEGRYPDGCEDTSDLKAFADWMTTVSESDFTSQKYQHLDVYKVAAYYVYLMLFGAVDQVVKNAMFTSEDGQHWYFINYDNDTINGLRNDGPLIYSPTINRQTIDDTFSSTVYAYAGHDSRLWNMLEADEDFMDIVTKTYQALYIAGLSYDNVIDMFDNQQSDKWCERIYNLDSEYKYIGPFSDSGINNLFMLQGSRQSHRRWWLSERFSLIDSQFISGEYRANTFEVKLAGAPIGLDFSIVAGNTLYYGYGVNNVPIESRIDLNRGDNHTFTTQSVLNVGDPLRIYAAPYLEEINISSFLPYMSQISIAGVYSNRLGTKLKKLYIGDKDSNQENTSLNELSGINQAKRLEELDISGLKGIASLNLSENTKLKKMEARKTAITSIMFASGAPIEYFGVPDSMRALSLVNLPKLTNDGLVFNNNGWNLSDITIKGCPKIDSYTFVTNWLIGKSTADSACSLTLDGIHWTGVSANMLLRFGNFRNVSLKGVIEVDEITEDQITQLYEIYGNNCFNSESELYIKVLTDISFLFGPDTVKALSTARFVVVSADAGETTFITPTLPEGVTFDDGLLTVGDIEEDATVIISAVYTKQNGTNITIVKPVTLQPLTYPSEVSFEGKDIITKVGVYEYAFTVDDTDCDGNYKMQVTLSIDEEHTSNVSIGNVARQGNVVTCDVTVNEFVETVTFGIKATVMVTETDRVLFEKTFTPVLAKSAVIMSAAGNPVMMAFCYQKGWAANPNFMTLDEAEAVTDITSSTFNGVTEETTFNEFQFFKNAPSFLEKNTMHTGAITEISYPFTSAETPTYFNIDTRLKKIHLPFATNISPMVTSTSHIEEVDVPLLEIVDLDIYSSKAWINSKYIKRVNAPKLKSIRVDFSNFGSCYVICTSDSAGDLEEVNLQSLESIEFDGGSGKYSSLYLIGGLHKLQSLDLPSLKSVHYSSIGFTFIEHVVGLQQLNLGALTELKATVSGSTCALMNSTALSDSPLYVDLKSLKKVDVYKSNYFSIRAYNTNSVTFNLNSLETFQGLEMLGGRVGDLNLQNLISGPSSTDQFYESTESWMTEIGYSSSVHIGKNVTKLNHLLGRLIRVKEVYIESLNAPSISTSYMQTGSDLPEGTEKVIYVPEDATGYTSGNWPVFLETTGFTISYTLPNPTTEE